MPFVLDVLPASSQDLQGFIASMVHVRRESQPFVILSPLVLLLFLPLIIVLVIANSSQNGIEDEMEV